MCVAPLVGAWIEIRLYTSQIRHNDVAPLVGAWIEINQMYEMRNRTSVAPLVGAWIEIVTRFEHDGKCYRRSSCRSVD